MDKPITERIRFLRDGVLQRDEKKLVDDIVKFGCHIIQVKPENGLPGWSYTIGLFEMLNQPEIVAVGLRDGLAHSVLNEVARRFEGGARFKEGHRESELIENVECEFRAVEKRWLLQLMGYAIWFYGDDNFPAMQCIYPDLKNRFPWERGFDSSWRNRQPHLFQSSQSTNVERDFWAINDPESSLFNWKFPVPPNTGVFTTKRIVNGEEPVLEVHHDAEDESWQFHGAGESSAKTIAHVCFHHIIDKDATIVELADLPAGWRAKREGPSARWVREPEPPNTE